MSSKLISTDVLVIGGGLAGERAAIEAAAADLLKAIRSMEGGEEIHAHLQFPLVAHMGEYDFWVVVVTPSVELWGKFMDEHANSDAVVEAEEKLFKLAVCPDNALFETVDLR